MVRGERRGKLKIVPKKKTTNKAEFYYLFNKALVLLSFSLPFSEIRIIFTNMAKGKKTES